MESRFNQDGVKLRPIEFLGQQSVLGQVMASENLRGVSSRVEETYELQPLFFITEMKKIPIQSSSHFTSSLTCLLEVARLDC